LNKRQRKNDKELQVLTNMAQADDSADADTQMNSNKLNLSLEAKR